MEEVKTVILRIASQAKVNFILRTKILELLRQEGFRVVILSPFYNDEKFRQEFSDDQVFLEPLPAQSRIARVLHALRTAALAINHPIMLETEELLAWWRRGYASKQARLAQKISRLVLKFIPGPLRIKPTFWNALEELFIRNKEMARIFNKYSPTIAITDIPDTEILVYCYRRRVPLMLVDLNIDALTARYRYILRPITKIAVSGEIMKRDAMAFQGLTADQIAMVGAIRYDPYWRKTPREITREEFLESLGADPDKRVILFGTLPSIIYEYSPDIIKIILQAGAAGKIPEPFQIIVSSIDRAAEDQEHYRDSFSDYKNIIFVKSASHQHRDFYQNLLRCSDVVISVGSTLNIEAALLGAPSLWIAFDGDSNGKIKDNAIRRFYEIPYLKNIWETGGIKLAESPEELVAEIAAYSQNRNRDSEKRRLMLEKLFFKLDGRAAQRLLETIKDITDKR